MDALYIIEFGTVHLRNDKKEFIAKYIDRMIA